MERKVANMWIYKIRYYEDGSYFTAEGIVAGADITDAIKRLKDYYPDTIQDILITATESGDGVLDLAEFPNIKYDTFFPEEVF